jgi:hypothetical protein
MDAQINPTPTPEPEVVLPHRFVVETYPAMDMKTYRTKATSAAAFGSPVPVILDTGWEVVLITQVADEASAEANKRAEAGELVRALKRTLH